MSKYCYYLLWLISSTFFFLKNMLRKHSKLSWLKSNFQDIFSGKFAFCKMKIYTASFSSIASVLVIGLFFINIQCQPKVDLHMWMHLKSISLILVLSMLCVKFRYRDIGFHTSCKLLYVKSFSSYTLPIKRF